MLNWDIKFLKKGFIFDDVLFIFVESYVLLNEVDMKIKLVDNLILNILIIIVVMDIVIDSKMVIVIVCVGGFGIIYKNMLIVD